MTDFKTVMSIYRGSRKGSAAQTKMTDMHRNIKIERSEK